MATHILPLNLFLAIFIVLANCYPNEFYEEESSLPIKRNGMNWLEENKNKNQHFKSHPDDVYSVNIYGNCKEFSINLILENNFMPSIIQHTYCHNVNNPQSNHCSYKDLICHQKTEAVFIIDKANNCLPAPTEHRRPVGCECKQNLQL